jgi:hypothetical protein
MQRFLVALVILLVAVLLSRDPHVEKLDGFFLDWLLRNTDPTPSSTLPLIVVDLNRASVSTDRTKPSDAFARSADISPLEFALFLQSILDFQPTVLAIEPLLIWRERDRDQEQVFLDQAMRIPKLLLGAELTSAPDPDTSPSDIPAFTHVSGRRGDLPTFTGIGRQPDEDLRLISALAFTNLPDDVAGETHVPLLFHYRGDVIPAFALQAFLTWARIPAGEVKVVLGSHIALPDGRNIPIRSDGTLIVNPNAAKLGHHLTLNELLLLAQQHPQNSLLDTLHDDLVLARTPAVIKPDETEELREARAAGILAAGIATLQSMRFISRISIMFDCVVVLFIALLTWPALHAPRVDVILGAIAFVAAYCLLAFGLMSRYGIFVPGIVPLGSACLLAIIALIAPRERHRAEPLEIAASPPAP